MKNKRVLLTVLPAIFLTFLLWWYLNPKEDLIDIDFRHCERVDTNIDNAMWAIKNGIKYNPRSSDDRSFKMSCSSTNKFDEKELNVFKKMNKQFSCAIDPYDGSPIRTILTYYDSNYRAPYLYGFTNSSAPEMHDPTINCNLKTKDCVWSNIENLGSAIQYTLECHGNYTISRRVTSWF